MHCVAADFTCSIPDTYGVVPLYCFRMTCFSYLRFEPSIVCNLSPKLCRQDKSGGVRQFEACILAEFIPYQDEVVSAPISTRQT
jgi:hypothetical protein